jgi:D-alanyl-D-alanine carboxypeptidase
MNLKTGFFLFALLYLGTGAFSQQINTAKLDSLFNALAENDKAMGSIAVSKNGKILYSKAIGYCLINDQKRISSTPRTKYRIGSITKMFTATMIFQLAEEGKISLNDKLNKFFPSIPNSDIISIANLLNHHSGIHSFTDDTAYFHYMTRPKTHAEMIKIISESKPDTIPGVVAAYSNSNYLLLGYIIEKICGKPYQQVLKDRITAKAGLSDTYYGDKTNINLNECYSYQFVTGWNQQPETDMSIPHGAGSIVSTPSDLTKFIESLFSGLLLSASSLDQMTQLTDGYGMGIFQYPFYERKAFGHTGGIDGFLSIVNYFPDDSLAMAYCTNGQVYPMNDILIGVLSIYFGRTYTIPVFKSFDIASDDLDKYTGVYSSTQLPLKITISKKNSTLFAQATGQSEFPLEAFETDKFKFDPAGILMEFNPGKGEFTLKQGGGTFLFTLEK